MEALHLITLLFATFWLWEAVLVLLPFRMHPALQPLAVFALGYYLNEAVSDKALVAAAVAGGVALLHAHIRANLGSVEPLSIRLPSRSGMGGQRSRRVPTLP